MQDDPAAVALDPAAARLAAPIAHQGALGVCSGCARRRVVVGRPIHRAARDVQRRDLPVALAYDSAAWLQGLSPRQPVGADVLATHPSQRKLPPALSDFRVTRLWGALEPEQKDHLPVWRVPTLLAMMAIEPHYYRDWPNVMEWLEEAFKRADTVDLEQEIKDAPHTALIWAGVSRRSCRL